MHLSYSALPQLLSDDIYMYIINIAAFSNSVYIFLFVYKTHFMYLNQLRLFICNALIQDIRWCIIRYLRLIYDTDLRFAYKLFSSHSRFLMEHIRDRKYPTTSRFRIGFASGNDIRAEMQWPARKTSRKRIAPYRCMNICIINVNEESAQGQYFINIMSVW